MKILLVEDDADQLYVRTLLLEQNGFEIVGASDRISALAVARTEQPVWAVMDLLLPTEEEGLALLRDLKAASPALRILLFTGVRQKSLEKRPELLLTEGVLQKGSGSAELIRKLQSQ